MHLHVYTLALKQIKFIIPDLVVSSMIYDVLLNAIYLFYSLLAYR